MHVCIHTYTYISQYNLLGPYNVAHMYVSLFEVPYLQRWLRHLSGTSAEKLLSEVLGKSCFLKNILALDILSHS